MFERENFNLEHSLFITYSHPLKEKNSTKDHSECGGCERVIRERYYAIKLENTRIELYFA